MTFPEYVGFSGSRAANAADEARIERVVRTLDRSRHILVEGCCEGVDDAVRRIGVRLGFRVHGVCPANRKLVPPDWREGLTGWEVMPPGSSYRDRDARVVQIAGRLAAFPLYPRDHNKSRRSGTWMTVRMAEEKPIPVLIFVLREADHEH